MVQKYVVHNTEMNRVNDGDLQENKEWSLVVKLEDYNALDTEYKKLVDAVIVYGLDPEHLLEWVRSL